jgi:uncharacterized RDD family membrane protein YckC
MSEPLAAEGRIHQLPTPEGIRLPFAVASAGERLSAYLIDMSLVAAAIFAGVLAALQISGWRGAGALLVLALFVVPNVYFIGCEVHFGGRTLGKRVSHLRVVSRDGGPLTAEAVLARNLTRELEMFLPLTIVFGHRAVWPDAAGWQVALTWVWLLVFATLPLWNADRLRCGDLIAGTLVVRVPQAVLLSDLAGTFPTAAAPRPALPAANAAAGDLLFTHQQLEIYGIHELQVLEDVLRRDTEGTLDPAVLVEIAGKIQRKIGWTPAPGVAALPFLQAFYRAQRGRLEHKLLFGKRQEFKR